jgi:Icc-related predicted phosphoesterase
MSFFVRNAILLLVLSAGSAFSQTTTTAEANSDAETTSVLLNDSVTSGEMETSAESAETTAEAEETTAGETNLALERITSGVLNIDIAPDKNPWTNLSFNNDPKNFQFAIVTDRTGGVRPGVFEDAVTKLNILQPEFVISVGDLIMGYSADRSVIDHEWDEFIGFVHRLKMPFFYVPGNHDMANAMEHRKWQARFGREYYHFVYRNVLFLCLNSDDPRASISAKQVEYARKALEENPNERSTLVIIHRPMRIQDAKTAAKQSNDENYAEKGWDQIEKLLEGREYTVFAGHLHKYTKFDRLGHRYFILATTGAGSPIRGARGYGEFDEVIWVTMTDAGPIVANLQLNGIWDQDVRTEEVAGAVNPLLRRGVETEIKVTDPVPFKNAISRIRLKNDADVPLKMDISIEPHRYIRFEPSEFHLTIEPNSVAFADVKLSAPDASDAEEVSSPLTLNWKGTYTFEGEKPLSVEGRRALQIDPIRYISRRRGRIRIDGKLGEWGELNNSMALPDELVGRKNEWKGRKDGSFNFALRYDDENLYLAVNAVDDRVIKSRDEITTKGDAILVQLGPLQDTGTTTPFQAQIAISKRDQKKLKSKLSKRPGKDLEFFVPAVEKKTTQSLAGLPEGAEVKTTRTARGFAAEMKIPLSSIPQIDPDHFEGLRVNLMMNDMDRPAGGDRTDLWWRPNWHDKYNYRASGTFVISSKRPSRK